MEVRHTEQFLNDLTKFNSALQQKCWSMLSTVRKGNAETMFTPGWRLHQLKSSPFLSLPVNKNYRMLCKHEGQALYVFRVVRHDLADSPHVNRNDAISTPYVLDDMKIEASEVFDALVSMGLPEQSVKPLKGVMDEDDFIDALGQLSPDLQTYALALYEITGLIVPRSKYTIFDTDEAFETTLHAGMEEWQIYLHPSQRYIVELPATHRVSVGGPAGTGKTVCAWYRAQYLAQQGYSVGFVCPNRRILEVSRQRLEILLSSTAIESSYYLVPNSSDDIVQLATAVDHLVVDEGQELATKWFPDLGASLSNSETGLTLFYDLNQLGGNIPRGDTKHIRHRFDTWHTRLASIPRLFNIPLHINYRNSREIVEYYRETLAPALPVALPSSDSLALFEAGEVSVSTIQDRHELGFHVARAIQALQRDYSDSEIGLIFNGSTRNRMGAVLTDLQNFSIRTTPDIRNTKMILCVSPREVKGHERKAIVFCTPPIQQSIRKWGHTIDVYVALTRARDRLVVLQSL